LIEQEEENTAFDPFDQKTVSIALLLVVALAAAGVQPYALPTAFIQQ